MFFYLQINVSAVIKNCSFNFQNISKIQKTSDFIYQNFSTGILSN